MARRLVYPGDPLYDVALSGHVGQAVMEEFIRVHGGHIERKASTGYMLELERRFRAGFRDGSIKRCRHIKWKEPVAMFWVPWAPERVMCADCHDRAQAVIKGTDEDRRCDQCGELAPVDNIYPMMSQSAAFVMGDVQWGPLTISFGLCPRDAEAQRASIR